MTDDEIKAALDRIGITAVAGYDQALAGCQEILDGVNVPALGKILQAIHRERDNRDNPRRATIGEFALLGFCAAYTAWRESKCEPA